MDSNLETAHIEAGKGKSTKMQRLNLTQEVVTHLTQPSPLDFVGTVYPQPGCPTCSAPPVHAASAE